MSKFKSRQLHHSFWAFVKRVSFSKGNFRSYAKRIIYIPYFNLFIIDLARARV